jgi:carboxylate-amine ligase
MEGELVDLPERETVSAKALARRLYDRLKDHAEDLGAASELEGVLDLLEHGNGAYRQRKVYEANRDFSELLEDIVKGSAP